MSEVIDKIVQVQQAEMDEEVANDQVRDRPARSWRVWWDQYTWRPRWSCRS